MEKSNILYIFVLWGLLIFIGYNVLTTTTVEASEKNDKKVCEQYNGEWKKINGDTLGNKGCNFDNDKDREAYSVRPGYSLDGTGSDAEYGRIDLDLTDDEAAAIEDDICDNEDADSTDIKICMSEKRGQQKENIEKACDNAGLKTNKKGECDAKGDEDNADKFQEELDEVEADEEQQQQQQEEEQPPMINDEIASPVTTNVREVSSEEEEEEEDIAQYNREADESHNGSPDEEAEITNEDAEEADSEEENESEEDEDDDGEEEGSGDDSSSGDEEEE